MRRMGATRAQVLLILQPLVRDVQRKIMRMIFPTYVETHELVKKLACEPDEWQDLITKLTAFAHSDVERLFVRLRAEDVRFAEHCCKHLQFDCLSNSKLSLEVSKPLSVLQAPEDVKWPKTVELAKSANWSMKTEVPRNLCEYFDPNGNPCEHCGILWTTFDDDTEMYLCPDCWEIEERPWNIESDMDFDMTSDILENHDYLAYLYDMDLDYDSDSDWWLPPSTTSPH